MKPWLLTPVLAFGLVCVPAVCVADDYLPPPPTPAEEPLPPPQPGERSPLTSPVPLEGSVPIPAVAPSCRTLSVPQLKLLEENCATTITKMTPREVVIGQFHPLEVDYHEEKQVITRWTTKEREVIQEVLCTKVVPVTTTDPCTGECHTEHTTCPVMRQVKVKVYDVVPEQAVVVVKVPYLKPGPPQKVFRLELDTTQEPAIETRLRLLTMPNEISVPAPPPPPCLGGACPGPHLPD